MAAKGKRIKAKGNARNGVLKLLECFVPRTPIQWVKLAAKIITSVYLSLILQSLTQSALWMPGDWREAITFVSSLIFVVGSELMRLISPAKAGHGRVHQHAHHAFIKVLLAFGSLLFFAFLLWRTDVLRTDSVWNFAPPPGWWGKQYGSAEPGAVPVKDAGAGQLTLPDFLSQTRGTLYFPPEVSDPQLKAYLLTVGKGDLRAGIKNILDREPMRLIDWAEANGAGIRKHYNSWFMLLHFGMILSLAVAWGLFNKEEEIATDAVLSLFQRFFVRS